jgi:hypothetical protein
VSADTYADAVIGALAADFPDLNDHMIAGIVRSHICTYLRMPQGHLEVIIDNPINARWRIVGYRDKPGRVRLGCWHHNPSSEVRARLDRLNAALDAIDVEVTQ